jgi:hypothetical protein
MKKTLLARGILTVLFYSCEKIEDEESTQATRDHLFAEQIFNDVGRIVEGAFLAYGINKSYPKYTILDTESSNADTLVINFGAENFLFPVFPDPGGKLRKGKLIITYTGKYRDSLAVMTTTFDNYYVNNNLVQGERIVTNQGRNNKGNMWFTIEVNNASIATNNGTINWNASRTREWVNGNTTYFDITDDQYKITGSANGTGVNNNSFSMEITDTLNVDLGCLPSCVIKSGKAKITPNGYADRIINYGDSLCDCNFDVTINGNTYPIVVN